MLNFIYFFGGGIFSSGPSRLGHTERIPHCRFLLSLWRSIYVEYHHIMTMGCPHSDSCTTPYILLLIPFGMCSQEGDSGEGPIVPDTFYAQLDIPLECVTSIWGVEKSKGWARERNTSTKFVVSSDLL